MNQFGTLLRFYREQCVDRDAARGRLTQARLGELLGEALGIAAGYTGAAVSEWERNRSQIHNLWLAGGDCVWGLFLGLVASFRLVARRGRRWSTARQLCRCSPDTAQSVVIGQFVRADYQ